MDYRTESFLRRFKNAQTHLKAKDIQEVVSFKYRDTIGNRSEYEHFVGDYLQGTLQLDAKPLDGNFGDRAWLVKDESGNCAIIVEHETGLEILGAIGSIASLIALIPMISSGWTKLRDRFSHRHFGHADGGIEIRRFNNKGKSLSEEQTSSVEIYVLNIIHQENALLSQKVQLLEKEVEKLKKAKLPKKRRRTSKPGQKPKRK